MTMTLDEILARAASALDHGAPQVALDLLNQADAECMLSPAFWYLRGASLHALARFEESAESFETLCELEPTRSHPRALAADAYVRVSGSKR